jgi:hypothetical protein
MKYLKYLITGSALLFLIACSSYQITKSSLSEQINGNSINKGYLFAARAVRGNDLTTVKCIDKNGKEVNVIVTNKTEVRITLIDNSSVKFYFDTLLIKDSTITGSKTHFFNYKVKPIKFGDIEKIQIMEQ